MLLGHSTRPRPLVAPRNNWQHWHRSSGSDLHHMQFKYLINIQTTSVAHAGSGRLFEASCGAVYREQMRLKGQCIAIFNAKNAKKLDIGLFWHNNAVITQPGFPMHDCQWQSMHMAWELGSLTLNVFPSHRDCRLEDRE